MGKKIFSVKNLLALCAVVCVGLAATFMSMPQQTTAKADASNHLVSDINKVEYFSGGDSMVLYLSNTDYMTATEWGTSNNDAYKWVAELSYEDRTEYNVHNAVLDKNLGDYNFADYIILNGKPLKEYAYTLVANKFTRVDSLGITIEPGVMAGVTKIEIKEGCTIPTLYHSYFGVTEYSAIEIEEGLIFEKNNGVFAKKYPFAGYETGVTYDASERFLYARAIGSTFQGFTEAATYEHTTVLAGYGWDDEGYSLASTGETDAGNVVVYDFVNPINANEVGLIYLRTYCNIDRTFATYNAYEAKYNDLGPVLEMYNTSGASFNTITLLSSLYADENGMIDRIVLQFKNSGKNEAGEPQQFFLASFSLGENTINTAVYDDSFFVQETEDSYDLTFRFNKRGAFTGTEALDTSKVFVNYVSIDEINAEGEYAMAKWVAIQGIYQIEVSISKAYTGAGQIKNVDMGYIGNSMSVEKGLLYPNGDVLDYSYACHFYAGEKFVDYEMYASYDKVTMEELGWIIDTNSASNIHMYFNFDKPVASQVYYHADQKEAWRAEELPKYSLYDAELAKVYVAGGFKSALLDSVVINGKTLGEWHAIDAYNTCIFVQYGQYSQYTLDVSIDSNSSLYKQFLPLFEAGEGVTIEVKKGMKFTTGTRTVEDAKFVLTEGGFVKQADENGISVFYNGKNVSNGELVIAATKVSESNIDVEGVSGYALTTTRDGNIVTFVITASNGETFTFSVEEKIANEAADNAGGCSANISNASMLMGSLGLLISMVPTMVRRKKDEE